MDLLEGIRTRRSVRAYTAEPVAREAILEILRAGTWAPSGLNNQPWRFAVATDAAVRTRLAALTRYGKILEAAPACIGVFLDVEASYHPVKDHQGMGACIQNMLLAAHALGLGAVWLGEILKSADAVREVFGLPPGLELMAVVALGHPAGPVSPPARRPLDDVLLREL